MSEACVYCDQPAAGRLTIGSAQDLTCWLRLCTRHLEAKRVQPLPANWVVMETSPLP